MAVVYRGCVSFRVFELNSTVVICDKEDASQLTRPSLVNDKRQYFMMRSSSRSCQVATPVPELVRRPDPLTTKLFFQNLDPAYPKYTSRHPGVSSKRYPRCILILMALADASQQ